MAACGLRRLVIFACLLGGLGGCRGLAPVQDLAAGQSPGPPSRSDVDPEEGWLWRRLTRKDPQPQQPADTSAAPMNEIRRLGGGVEPVSAVEPVPAGPTPEETLAAASGTSRARFQPRKKNEDPLDPFAWAETLSKRLKSWAGYGPNEQLARAAFEEGRELFRQGRYEEAAEKFALAADRWPDSALEEDSLFLLGESYFFADRYPKAHEAYETLLNKYEFSRHVDRTAGREFAIGRYWEQLYYHDPQWVIVPNLTDKTRPLFDTWGHALKAYEHVRINDPAGPLADDAIMATATAHFLRGRFEEAAHQYDVIRKEYPKSEHQMKAHLLALQSKQQIYQGPLYDGTPLREVAEIADQTLLRFGPALGGERGRVIDAKNRAVEQLAARDLAVGRYYDKNRFYGAARIYYQSVIDEYPQTQAAELARQRLQEIRNLPAEPPNRFQWLVDLFEVDRPGRRSSLGSGP